MYAEAELALIGMNRYDDALEMAAQAARLGVTSSGNTLTAGYLDGKEDVVAAQVNAIRASGIAGGDGVGLAELYRYGVLFGQYGEDERWVRALENCRCPDE